MQTGIYNNMFVEALAEALPADMKSQAKKISDSGYLVQQTYPLGSDERDAAIHAWRTTQKYSSIAATVILAGAIPAIAVWKNYKVTKKQNKGTVL